MGKTKEAGLLKVIDRLLPFLHNISSKGRAWKDNSVHRNQVLKMHQFIEKEHPDIYQWFMSKLEHAVKQGWLDAS